MSWVLVVDDEPAVTRLVQQRLEAEGYDVEVAPNGADALEKLAARDYDVLITDLCMPRLNGQDLVETVLIEHRQGEVFEANLGPRIDLSERRISQRGKISKPASKDLFPTAEHDACELRMDEWLFHLRSRDHGL